MTFVNKMWNALNDGLALIPIGKGCLQLCEAEREELWPPYTTPSARLIKLVHSTTQHVWGYAIYEILDPKDAQACFVACGSLYRRVRVEPTALTILLADITVSPKHQKRGLGTLLTAAALCRGVSTINTVHRTVSLTKPLTSLLWKLRGAYDEAAETSETQVKSVVSMRDDDVQTNSHSVSHSTGDRVSRSVSGTDVGERKDETGQVLVLPLLYPAIVDARSIYVRRILKHMGFDQHDEICFGTKDVHSVLAREQNMQQIIGKALHKLEESQYSLLRRTWRRCFGSRLVHG